MDERRPNAERWATIGAALFALLCVVFAQMGQSVSADLQEGYKGLRAAVAETKAAMKDPNFYAVLITNQGVVSDSENVEKRLGNAEAGVLTVEDKAKALESRLRFFEFLSIAFSAIAMMGLFALTVRLFKSK